MNRGGKLERFFTIRVPTGYVVKLEQARRVLGARSASEVVRLAVDRLLWEVLKGDERQEQ
jgi:hypothetical protein